MPYLLILLRLLFFLFFIWYFFFIVHTGMTPTVLMIEKKKIFFFIFFLKFFFFYNIFFSIFLKKIKLYWIFFFYNPCCTYTFCDMQELIVGLNFEIENRHLEVKSYIANGVYLALEFNGIQDNNINKRNLNILFNDYRKQRFFVPKKWTSIYYTEFGRFVNNSYFKLWLKYQNIAFFFGTPINYRGHKISEEDPKLYEYEDLILLSYKKRKDYRIDIKKYRIK